MHLPVNEPVETRLPVRSAEVPLRRLSAVNGLVPWRGSPCRKSNGESAPAPERQYRDRCSSRRVEPRVKEERILHNDFHFFAGIDWGSERHRVCLVDQQGHPVAERWIDHSGSSLAELVDWLRERAEPRSLAAAIEIPRGAIVETLLEHGFAVYSINPKQLDRFRDRYSPAGAKDDRRDAFVLADSLRTDMLCFHAVRLDEPVMIRLRELSRLEDELSEEFNRVANRLREQFHRFFPQLLQFSESASDPWLWTLFEIAPSPDRAAKLTEAKITRILGQHRIRRIDAKQVRAVLKTRPFTLAPGAAEAASEHALLLLPRLRLLHQQRTDLARRVQAILDQMATPTEPQSSQHRDAAILLSLPGLGRKVAATMLSEASEAIAARDYHALRCYSGTAPVTVQSGKKKVVTMRMACNKRLRNALYHWARKSILWDPKSKSTYAQLRACGKSHGTALRSMADRWLKVLVSMLRHNTLYDLQHRAA
jgi:transposase